jgi:hypothetical protein
LTGTKLDYFFVIVCGRCPCPVAVAHQYGGDGFKDRAPALLVDPLGDVEKETLVGAETSIALFVVGIVAGPNVAVRWRALVEDGFGTGGIVIPFGGNGVEEGTGREEEEDGTTGVVTHRGFCAFRRVLELSKEIGPME